MAATCASETAAIGVLGAYTAISLTLGVVVAVSVCTNPRLRLAIYGAVAANVTQAGMGPGRAEPSVEADEGAGQAKPPVRLQSWQIRMRDLRVGRSIGQGSVGEVFAGDYNGQEVAIKRLKPSAFRAPEMVERFRDEIYLMSTVTHPNVLVFIGAVLHPAAGNLCLVTELCHGGNLADHLRSEQIRISWSTRIQMAADIARGMHYLHGRAGIIQRDLKAANLLLDDFQRVKIADFGLSRAIGPGSAMQTYCGTPASMAPEVVLQQDYDERADIYSFAIIMWELLTRQEPYPGQSGLTLAMAVANEGKRPQIPSYCPTEWAHVMTRAWAPDPDDRPGFDEILDTLLGMQRICDEQIELEHAQARAQQPEETKEQAIAPRGRRSRRPSITATANATMSSMVPTRLAAAYQSAADLRLRARMTGSGSPDLAHSTPIAAARTPSSGQSRTRSSPRRPRGGGRAVVDSQGMRMDESDPSDEDDSSRGPAVETAPLTRRRYHSNFDD